MRVPADDIQIITTPSGEELVVMPLARYEALTAPYDEDEDDAAIYDQRKAELNPSASHFPEAISAFMLDGNTRLKAIRRWRDVTQNQLSSETGLAQGYLSDLETGRRAGSSEALKIIAGALDVPVDWIA